MNAVRIVIIEEARITYRFAVTLSKLRYDSVIAPYWTSAKSVQLESKEFAPSHWVWWKSYFESERATQRTIQQRR